MDYALTGDILHMFIIASNLGMTSFAMLGLQDEKRSVAFDDWWTEHGFCIDKCPERLADTEVLCSIVLIASAVITYGYHNTLWRSKDTITGYHSMMDSQLRAKLEGGMFSNFAHGAGHLFLYLLDAPPPAMHFAWTWGGMGNAVQTLCFFVGVFRALLISLSWRGTVILACAAIAMQYALDVPPGLVFTYSQTVILVAGSVDQLLLPEKGRTYAWVAATFLPLLLLFPLEMTQCTPLLAEWGGHAVYDLYLSALPLAYFSIARTSIHAGEDPKVDSKKHR